MAQLDSSLTRAVSIRHEYVIVMFSARNVTYVNGRFVDLHSIFGNISVALQSTAV